MKLIELKLSKYMSAMTALILILAIKPDGEANIERTNAPGDVQDRWKALTDTNATRGAAKHRAVIGKATFLADVNGW